MKNEIIAYLKKHGESQDADIAKEVGISLPKLLPLLAELTAKGDIMSYKSTKFVNKKPIEGMRCRVSGFIPKAAPGRKSGKVQLKLS
jgi:DNA-binding Lrp family transcriptional regulator